MKEKGEILGMPARGLTLLGVMYVRGFGHTRAKCPSYKKKILGKALNVTLTNNESSFDDQSEVFQLYEFHFHS